VNCQDHSAQRDQRGKLAMNQKLAALIERDETGAFLRLRSYRGRSVISESASAHGKDHSA
jgi:hypothetical protein